MRLQQLSAETFVDVAVAADSSERVLEQRDAIAPVADLDERADSECGDHGGHHSAIWNQPCDRDEDSDQRDVRVAIGHRFVSDVNDSADWYQCAEVANAADEKKWIPSP